MESLRPKERQYVAYYVMNIMRKKGDGRPQYTMEAPSGETRMRELRCLTAIIADLQGEDEGAEGVRRVLRRDFE